MGFATACELACERLEQDTEHIATLAGRLTGALLESIPSSRLNADGSQRLAGTVNMRFPGIEAETLLMALDLEGVGVSLGSACTAGSTDPSHVLLAMGLSHDEASSSLRFSVGHGNTMDEIEAAITIIENAVKRLNAAGG